MSGSLVQGSCDARFAAVRELLAQEFASGRVLGQAVAVVLEGRTVVSLWGGYRDELRRKPWTEDTLSCLFSASKPLAAAPLLQLIGEGRADLDTPVAHYWPAFAAGGKEAVTLRQVLSHHAGVPIAAAAAPGSLYDYAGLIRALEQQVPVWPPGSQGCFHSFTYGLLVGELAARIAGREFSALFRETIGAALQSGIAFSLTPGEQARCADVVLVAANPLLQMLRDPGTLLGRSWAPLRWDDLNSARFRACNFPSFGGHASARGLAGFYGMMADGGRCLGHPLLAPAIMQEALTEQWHAPDAFMGAPVRMGLGFMLANEPFRLTGSASSFGQPGLGGVAGFGDSSTRLGIGITCNLLSGGIENPALAKLVATIVACV